MSAKISIVFLSLIAVSLSAYTADWTSLDARPVPDWFDNAKFGIFIHWGVFAVPAFGDEWFWERWKTEKRPEFIDYMKKNWPANWTYQDFAPLFTAKDFNSSQWADVFQQSGAKYVVLTAKHHDGYTLWPSNFTPGWNALDVGPKRDLVGELGVAVRAKKIRYGLYHSLMEWYNPMFMRDAGNGWATTDFSNKKNFPETQEMVNRYKPDIIWSDGVGGAYDKYWRAPEMVAWLYNESPVKDFVAINDRWSEATACKHGGFWNCGDRFDPAKGRSLTRKWEVCWTIYKNSWGYVKDDRVGNFLTLHEILTLLIETVAFGGNLLLNIGPTKEGIIPPTEQQRLLDTGKWLGVNGEAIYETKKYTVQNDTLTPNVYYTAKSPVVYSILLTYPANNVLALGALQSVFQNAQTTVEMLGVGGKLTWKVDGTHTNINLPAKASTPSSEAWALKIHPGGQ